jgi:uncharacterized Zn finger protein (UPF0148 family)
MYYLYNCPYCSKDFYVYNENKEEASKQLLAGLKKHEHEWGEDNKDETLTENDEETEANMIYDAMKESNEIPLDGYPIE